MAKKNPYNAEFVKRASEWIQSKEGQASLDASLKKAEESHKKFMESIRVTPEMLQQRIMI